jgi:hypothetical protein
MIWFNPFERRRNLTYHLNTHELFNPPARAASYQLSGHHNLLLEEQPDIIMREGLVDSVNYTYQDKPEELHLAS